MKNKHAIIYRIMRNNISRIILFIILCTFFIANGLLLNYVLRLELINSYNNTPYNKYAKCFVMLSEDGMNIDLSKICEEEKLDYCVLFKNNIESLGMYEIIYCGNNAVSFKEKNFANINWASGEKLAVVGSASKYEIGDKIYIADDAYIVAGRLEEHICEIINLGIFYTNNNIENIEIKDSYILASAKYKNVKDGFDKLLGIVEKSGIKVEENNIRNAEFTDYIKYDKLFFIIIFLLLMFYILLILVINKIWNRVKRPEIFVRNMLGDKNARVKIYKEYVLIWIGSYFTGSFLCITLSAEMYFGIIPLVMEGILWVAIAIVSSISICKAEKDN